nr:hypothetical protein [Prevotella sp.]
MRLQSPKARLEFRKKWSKQIVDRLMDMLRRFRAAGDYCHREMFPTYRYGKT